MTAASRLVAPVAGAGEAAPAGSGMSGGTLASSGGRAGAGACIATRTVSRKEPRAPPMAEVLTVMRRVCGAGVAMSCMVADGVKNG